MTDDVESFLTDLQQEVSLAASGEGSEIGAPEAFTRYMFDVLSEAGEIDDADVAMYEARGARASGFCVSEDESTLWLFLTDYRGDLGVQALGKSELETHFKRMTGFLDQASEGLWRRLEESAPTWDMAHRLDQVWKQLGEIRLVVLTNADLRTRIPVQAKHGRKTVHHAVWDLSRLQQLSTSGRGQEPITVDVVDSWGKAIPCLGPQGETGAYSVYMTMFPGEFIARIYELYGPRLLELNVRSFLQSRGKVNRGIQETIKTEPARFLAYNNGVSMTAASVDIVDLPGGGKGLARIHDLQIVNGGQTTASLHYAKVKNKADLSQLFVQAKLSVVEPTLLMDLVPQISEFANSQNRVNMADFSANDPFHVELEKLSRTIWAPGRDGSSQMTRWFYERARGQYADAHARERTPARQRQFKQVQPLAQKFTKTDLAKFENTWDQIPHVVSFGAEKNFREFMLRLEKRGAFKPDQAYFELLIGKAILFRTAEKLIGALKLGGYRAQTVTYTLGKLLNATGQRIDLRAIWRGQELSPALRSDIEDLGSRVHEGLLATAGTRNVSEWAKKEDCWKAILGLEWTPSAELTAELVSAGQRTRTRSDASVAEILTDEERAAMDSVSVVAGAKWFELSQWAKQTDNLQSWQRSIAFSLGRQANAGKPPSRKQAIQGAKILDEAARLGFAVTD